MGGVNCCVFGGILAQLPEAKEYELGKILANFDLAVDNIWKDRDGHRNRITEWVHCVCYGNEAKIVLKYFRKGEYYLVEGKMRTDKWETDGVKKHKTRIIVHHIHMVAPPPRGTKPPPSPDDGET